MTQIPAYVQYLNHESLSVHLSETYDTICSLCSVSELRVFLSESWKDHANFTDIHDMGSAVQDLESIIHRATNNYSKDFPVHQSLPIAKRQKEKP